MSIEAWVTDPGGTYIAHLERSEASPFRRFAFSVERGSNAGSGSLEHHLENELIETNPGLLADGNLVWMRYRGTTRVWIVEERSTVLDESEHATDWVKVTGSGAKQLLGDRTVWPTAFAETVGGLNPASWGNDNQWRRFVNRACGEMLWDLIDESNPRFATQIARGTVETTDADGWTQDFRFDNLLDVVSDVVAAYGEIDLDGLTFSYRNAPGVDRSATVIFEESADLKRVERTESDRDTLSWIVAEGVGEGVMAKLAVAEDTTVARRREAYVDAKDAGNVPLVQLRANAAIIENARRDSIAVEIEETRFRAFLDFDLHDTVRAIAPSRGIDATGRVVALYVAEADDDRIRVAFDLHTPREDEMIRLEEGARATRYSVGVRNRQPQGQLVPFSFSGQGVFDTDDTLEVHLFIPDRMYIAIETRVAIDFRQFFAPAKDAASGGGSTSGASSAASSDNSSSHTHVWAAQLGGATGGKTLREYREGGPGAIDFDLPSDGTGHLSTDSGDSVHSHGIAHTHSTPNHTHGLTYGVFKEAYPASHSVTLKVYELVTGVWTLRTTIAGLADDSEDVELTEWITGPGQWMLTLQSEAAQPNGGRLGAYVSGYVLGAIQSA